MTVSQDEFKNTMRHFSSGVTIVTVQAGDQVHGLTASAVTSVSTEPPLISVIINQQGRAHPLLQRDDAVFAVNILSEAHQSLSDRFAWTEEDRFAEGAWATAATGAPVLDDALAWLDCTIHSRHNAGTHTIYVGEVQASKVIQPERKPLVYWNRNYHMLTTE